MTVDNRSDITRISEMTFSDQVEMLEGFLLANKEDVAQFFDEHLVDELPALLEETINVLLDYADDADIYELYDDGCPWDFSGDTRETGEVTNDMKVGDFLQCMSGNWKPTYMSGCGKHHQTYGDEFWEDETIVNQGYHLTRRATAAYLAEKGVENVSCSVISEAVGNIELSDMLYDTIGINIAYVYGLDIDAFGITEMTIKELSECSYDDERWLIQYILSL